MKSAVVDTSAYDWEGDAPLHRSLASTVIYETHVAGFTRHPSSGVAAERRGTYAGMIEKIPYLRELGITAVELLPVFQFDRQDCPAGLVNVLGIFPGVLLRSSHGLQLAEEPLGPSTSSGPREGATPRRYRGNPRRRLQPHGGGNAEGPTSASADWRTTCTTSGEDRARYANYSGTGNTLNANQSIVRRMILDSLRYWVREMHVDGFRFDLAAILARDESGRPHEDPPDTMGHRVGSRPRWDQADRGTLGRRGSVPGSGASSETAGWNGMAPSATMSAVS
jgi:glycogen operon protein